MVIAADYPFLDVLWTMIIFFAWVAYIWMIVVIFGDIFRRRDIGGFAKAAWCLFMIVVPFLGVLVYLIAQHDGMAERSIEGARRQQEQFDEQVRAAAAARGRCRERDREGPAAAREGRDQPGRVRRDQGEGARSSLSPGRGVRAGCPEKGELLAYRGLRLHR